MEDQLHFKCPRCGAELSHDRNANHCFCSYCGEKILFARSAPEPNVYEPEGKKNEPEEENTLTVDREKEDRMRKKRERWKWAVLIGSLITVADILVGEFTESDGIFMMPGFFIILPLVVGLFYPFDEEWGIVKCIFTWLLRSVLLWIGWLILNFIVLLPFAFFS